MIKAVYLNDFNLIAGGNINLTSGVNTVVLDSVGPNTQIHLRELPPAPSTTTSTATESTPVLISAANGNSSADLTFINTNSTPISSSSSTTTSPDTLEAGQSTTITNEGCHRGLHQTQGNGGQTLTGISGTFAAGTNIVEPLPTGQPSQTQPPAPPGVILKINRVNGSSTRPVNLFTDPKVFGYDPTTGQVIRFDINLKNDTGAVDSTFAPISVPGDQSSVGLNLGWNGNQLDVLVGSGTTVYAYNATTGAAAGAFTTSEPANSIGSADTVTVLGSYATNSLQMINLPASLQTGTAQPARESTSLHARAGVHAARRPDGFARLNLGHGRSRCDFQYVHADSVSARRAADQYRQRKSVTSGLSYNFSGGTLRPFTQNGAFINGSNQPAHSDTAGRRPRKH